jgi:DNA-directed RNA polymerase subunit H (RpoH/RPB5)
MYNVLKNIAIMVYGYWRGEVLTPIPTQEEFHKEMKLNAYYVLNVACGKDKYTFVIVNNPELTRTVGEVTKLIHNIGDHNNLWIISDNDPSSHVTSAGVRFRLNSPTLWYIEIPKGPHCALAHMPPYKSIEDAKANPIKSLIMTPEERTEYYQKQYKNDENCKSMLWNDPLTIWLGAKSGELVKVTRPSKIAGMLVEYYLVH